MAMLSIPVNKVASPSYTLVFAHQPLRVPECGLQVSCSSARAEFSSADFRVSGRLCSLENDAYNFQKRKQLARVRNESEVRIMEKIAYNR